jgi:DNA-binding MarR family transcriptional regulator
MQQSLGTTGATLDQQARRLHAAAGELLRRYQFRDRNEICCHGVSVAQCYALETLVETGGTTMGELARRQRVAVSTMTRVVDGLVDKGLVNRWFDPDDRRVCRVGATGGGVDLVARITDELVAREKAVLGRLPAAHRESLIGALEEFAAAMGACCPAPSAPTTRERTTCQTSSVTTRSRTR